MSTALERMRAARRASTSSSSRPEQATQPITFLTSAIPDWATDASAAATNKSWADVALDDAPSPGAPPHLIAPARESATDRLARLRKATASSSSSSSVGNRASARIAALSSTTSSFAARVDAARAEGGDVVVQFAPLSSGDEDPERRARRVRNQLDRAERKRRRDVARARDLAEQKRRAASDVAREERRASREAVKLGNAARRVEAQQAAKRKRADLHAAGKQTPGEVLSSLQRRKLFIHLEGWNGKDEPEALRRARIGALRHVLAQFGAVAKLQFDFPHKHAFVTFADNAGSEKAFDGLSTLPRRELAARNTALALNLAPAPLTGEHFEVRRASYLKRSKAHKKARTQAANAQSAATPWAVAATAAAAAAATTDKQ
jgi:hypothetical protein